MKFLAMHINNQKLSLIYLRYKISSWNMILISNVFCHIRKNYNLETHTMYCCLLLQIHLCCLWLLLCSRVTICFLLWVELCKEWAWLITALINASLLCVFSSTSASRRDGGDGIRIRSWGAPEPHGHAVEHPGGRSEADAADRGLGVRSHSGGGRSAGAGHHGDSRDGRSLRQDESEEERGAAGRLPALPQRGRYSRYVFTYSCSPEVLPLCRHLCLKTCYCSYLCNYIYYI